MTVSTQTTKVQYTGNGVTTAFTGTFRILDQTHLTVILTSPAGIDTAQALTTNYTVSGVSAATFTVTFLVAPPSGHTVTITRNVPLTQELDLVLNDEFPSTEIEAALDKSTMAAQQVVEAVSRALKTAASDTAVLQDLPPVAQRASKYLAFDASGNPIAASSTPNTVPVSAFMQTVLDDATAAAARTTLNAAAATSATTTAEGLIELATQAEANTGTDAVRALTPATLASISPASVLLDPAADQALILDASDANKLKRASLGSLAFQATYASADQTITLAGSLTLAHGLASTPRVVMAYLRCATAELGYSVNQETQCMAASSSALSAGAGSCILAIVPDATNINIRFPASALLVGHYTTGAATSITPASWRLKVYAYV